MRKRFFLFLALLFGVATIYNFVGLLKTGTQNVTAYDIIENNVLPLLGSFSFLYLYFYNKKNINLKLDK